MKDADTTEFHEFTDEEKAAWKEVLLPVHDEMAGRIGADLIAQIKAATAQ